LLDRGLADEVAGLERVWIVAAGKAAAVMARAAQHRLGAAVHGGLVIAPKGAVAGPIQAPLRLLEGEHPEPGAGSEAAGREALALAEWLSPDAQLLVLLSGGASALMALPARGVSLEDKRRTTALLLRAGADIYALNTVRKHASALKGGWLAARTTAACRTFAISDVIGDDLSVIGSGPTVADPSMFADALDVLRRFGGADVYPPSLVAHLDAGAAGRRFETPKPGDPRLARSTATVIGTRYDAMNGAAAAARQLGYHTIVEAQPIRGEAREVGPAHVDRVLAATGRLPRPCCVVSSGETTVTVRGAGRGGRNQELALASAARLAAFGGIAGLASVGTDGVDGPTNAAGAFVDSTTVARAGAAGLPACDDVLAANDSYSFFAALGDLFSPGPTGTNVGDLQVLLVGS
jgi:hydroxypyruvate reductase